METGKLLKNYLYTSLLTTITVLSVFFYPASVFAEVLEVASTADSATKILRYLTYDPNWLSYNYNDTSWPIPYEVWDNDYWINNGIHPTGELISPPTPSFYFLDPNSPSNIKVIQSTGNVYQPPGTQDFVRRKFTIPSNAQINKAYLYIASDNLSRFWINGNEVNTTASTHFSCTPYQTSVTDTQIEGGVRTFNVLDKVQPGNNILAASLLNTTFCDMDHPMGIQFFIYIDYSLIPTPAPGAPNITGLRVYNSSPSQTTFSGTWNKASGLQQAQNGSSWLNPMNIRLSATPGTGTLSRYYVAFYDQKMGTSSKQTPYASIIDATGNPTSNLQTLLKNDYRNGFILRYDATGSQYYVWDPSQNSGNGAWQNITSYTSQGWSICGSLGCTNQTFYKAYPIDNTPTWKILFDKNFGSKNMYTAAHVVDNTPLSAFQADIIPTPGP